MEQLLNQALMLLRSMWRFRWVGVATAWIVAVLGAAAVMRIEDRYSAYARVYVDTDTILKPLMAGLAVQPNVEQQVAMLSRTLLSRPNREKLVRMADLDLNAGTKEKQDKIIEGLGKDIKITSSGRDNLYTISYQDADPERSKRVVQSLVSMFVESSLGSSRKDSDQARTFLTEQIKTFESKLEAAEARLKEFRLRNIDLTATDGKDATQRLAEASAQLESARLQLREAENARNSARQQLTAAERAISQAGSGSTEAAPVQITTPEIDARIDGVQRSLDGLLQRYTDQHPDVINARRMLRDLREQKDREVAALRKAAADSPTQVTQQLNNDSGVQEMRRLLAASEVQVASLSARVNEFAGRYAAAKEGLKIAPQIEAEAAQLNRDYQITKKNYEELVTRRQTALMSGELDSAAGIAEFRLIDPPRASAKPVYPNRPLFLLAVLGIALGLGLTIPFVLSQVRPVFQDGEDLRKFTGLPLLGVVSAVASEADQKRSRRSLMHFLSATGSLVGAFAVGIVGLALATR